MEEVTCEVCNRNFKIITNSHLKRHNLLPATYLAMFPDSTLIADPIRVKKSLSMMGHPTSDETKKKISLAHKGKKLSEEHCRKISLIQRGIKRSEEFKQKLRDYNRVHGNPNKGKIASEETRRKIGEAGKGRVPWNKGLTWSSEIRERISRKLKGQILSLETRHKMSKARIGKKHSLESRKKMSQAKKGVRFSDEHLYNLFKALECSPNKLETFCIQLFADHNLPLKFVGDFKSKEFFIAGKVPDFVSTNSKRILVEVYSDYWKIRIYGSVENFKKKRFELFSKYGWKTLFFSEKELRQTPISCIEKLKEELL